MGNLCTRPPSTLEEDLGLARKKTKKGTKKKPSSSSAKAASPASLRHSFARSASSTSTSSSPTHRAIRLLGRGAFADTWLFQHLATRRLVAIKLFSRPLRRDQVPSILREVGVQAELGPSCARLVEVFECVLTPSHVGVVMEFGAGGSLTSYVGEKWSTALPGGLVVREELARYLFRQFIDTVAWLHDRGVAHRDLKLDNTLLDGSDPPCIKICDFGFAARLKPAAASAPASAAPAEAMPSSSSSSATAATAAATATATASAAAAADAAAAAAPPPATPRSAAAAQQHLERAYTRHIGTAEYMSPELLHPPPSEENLLALAAGKPGQQQQQQQQQPKRFGYDARSSDIWSAGVFLCVVLLGAFPFEYSKKEVTSLEDAELDLWLQETARAWSDSPLLAANIRALPADARDLLDEIFEVDPAKRITVEGIRAHPWYARPLKEPELAEALERQDAAQRAVDAHIAHRKLDTAKVAARVAALRELLKEATKPPPPGGDGVGGGGDGNNSQRRRIDPLQQLDAGEHWIRRVDLTEASMLVDGYRCGCSRDQPGIAGRELLAASLSARDSTTLAEAAAGGGGAEAPAAAAATATAATAAARSSGDKDNNKAKRSRGIGRGSLAAVVTKAKGDRGGDEEEAAATAAAATAAPPAAATTAEAASSAEEAAAPAPAVAVVPESSFAVLTEDIDIDSEGEGGAAAASAAASGAGNGEAASAAPSLLGA